MSDYEVPAGDGGRAVSLPAMRVRYTPGPLHEADVEASPLGQVRRWLAEAMQEVVDAIASGANSICRSGYLRSMRRTYWPRSCVGSTCC